MKILVLHDQYRPIVNGAIGGEDNLVDLEINLLREIGHEVFDLRNYISGRGRKFNQVRASSYGSNPLILKKIAEFKPQIVHAHNMNQVSGFKWMSKTDIPIFWSLHNYRIFCPISIAWKNGKICTKCKDNGNLESIKNGCNLKLSTLAVTRSSIFQKDHPELKIPRIYITSSEKMKASLRNMIPEEKMKILHNPSFGNLLNIPGADGRNGWLFAGRLTQEKGILNLIETWPESEFLDIAGDGPLRSAIQKAIVYKPNIKLIGVYSPANKEIYAKYTGLIFASTWLEGSPLVVLDAISAGTPVITNNVSSAEEIVEKSKGGVIIEGVFTTEKLKLAMNEVKLNFTQFSANAIKSSKSEFSSSLWIKQLTNIFEEIKQISTK